MVLLLLHKLVGESGDRPVAGKHLERRRWRTEVRLADREVAARGVAKEGLSGAASRFSQRSGRSVYLVVMRYQRLTAAVSVGKT